MRRCGCPNPWSAETATAWSTHSTTAWLAAAISAALSPPQRKPSWAKTAPKARTACVIFCAGADGLPPGAGPQCRRSPRTRVAGGRTFSTQHHENVPPLTPPGWYNLCVQFSSSFTDGDTFYTRREQRTRYRGQARHTTRAKIARRNRTTSITGVHRAGVVPLLTERPKAPRMTR